jgi:Deoxycytidylate deaminase
MTDKHRKFMEIARSMANQLSKDRTRKVGAIFIGEQNQPLTWGYNGFPRGANDDVEERHQHPLKLLWSEHAERNAIYNATRSGVSLLNSRVYITTLPPCVDCARALIQVGVKEVYIEADSLSSKDWTKDWDVVQEMFKECGVTVTVLP